MGLRVVIIAAGKGTRMKSHLPKVLHKVAGIPMLGRVLEASRSLEPERIVAVVGDIVDLLDHTFGRPEDITWAVQRERLGTGHAVRTAEEAAMADGGGDVLVLNGDMPRLTGASLARFLERWRESGADAALVSTDLEDPSGYGRVLRDGQGSFLRVVEDRDASEAERRIREVSVGLYAARGEVLFDALARISNDNDQGEYYLPDAYSLMFAEGRRVEAVRQGPSEEFMGVNDRAQLAEANLYVHARKARELMLEGVTILDPRNTYVDEAVHVGLDSLLEPGVVLHGRTRIGESCRVGAGSVIRDAVLEDGVEVRELCHVEGAHLRAKAVIGPFARLREGTELGPGARVGNFVETKKAVLEEGVKANHLSYLGDCRIGVGANIGAGTITCNYDGFNKNHTDIGARAFIGSNSTLVAPVVIEQGAYVGAGSVVNKRVPEDSLALGRSRQVNKEGYARRVRERFEGRKEPSDLAPGSDIGAPDGPVPVDGDGSGSGGSQG